MPSTLSLVVMGGNAQRFLPAGKSFQTELTFKKLGYATTVMGSFLSGSCHQDIGSSACAHHTQQSVLPPQLLKCRACEMLCHCGDCEGACAELSPSS